MKRLLFLIMGLPIIVLAGSSKVISVNPNDTVDGHVDYLEKKYYKLKVYKEKTITVKLTHLEADVDLYLEINKKPKIRYNSCYSSNSNQKNEECTLSIPAPKIGDSSSVMIMVYGFKESSYKLEIISKNGKEKLPEISSNPITGHVDKAESYLYKFMGQKGKSYTTTLFGLSNDADLRVSIGRRANLHTFSCKSINAGRSTDECSVTLKKDAPVYVQVYGYRAADYQIKTVQKKDKNRELIDRAKSLCYDKNDITEDHYICSSERDIVYIMDYSHLGYADNYKVYRINTNPLDEAVELTLDKELKTQSSAKFIPLKNTDLIAISTYEDQGDLFNYQNFYSNHGKVQQMSLLYQGHSEPYSNTQGKAETIHGGKKLRITYKSFIDRENGWIKFEDIYDIRYTSKIKKISHKRI